MDNALLSSPYANSINAQSLISRIITEITPFVRQALEQEVQKAQKATANIENDVVAEIIRTLKPTVIQVVQATVSGSNQVF